MQKFSQKIERYFPKFNEWLVRSLLFSICFVEYNFDEEENDLVLDLDDVISPFKKSPTHFFGGKKRPKTLKNLRVNKLKREARGEKSVGDEPKSAKLKKKGKSVGFKTMTTF